MRIYDTTQTQRWIQELAQTLNLSEEQAYTALRSTLHRLRDRMQVDEATDLASQFPLLLKGIYYDGYTPAGKPEKMDDKEFISKVHADLNNDPDISPRSVVDKTLTFLRGKLVSGQAEHVRANLPKNLEELMK